MEKRLLTEKRIELIQEAISRILGNPDEKRIIGEQKKCIGWSPPLHKPYKSYRHASVAYLANSSPDSNDNEHYIEFIRIEVPKGHEDSPWINKVAEAVHEILHKNNEPPLSIELIIFKIRKNKSFKSTGSRTL